ncbi:Outer membrane protein assembly factor BamA precursor [Pelagimonas phthalicica]|uniref:Outer membrane protein assembly factor BamA n=1 Tax=Pelagimonas phthalicica TaxID=1037362 RepID=A0A238JDR9_9RHOB|nr:Beta-barrel assembly machine subunit BamA [Pelagimonas phthalicica]SMX28102.1 Outer membrane protein assembly factor BamA precursor [Pelagimonas phthalicica]
MAKVISARNAQVGFKRENRVSRAAKIVAVSMALAAGVGAATLPQTAYAQSYAFTSVSIEGNERIEGATILSYAGIARGQRVSAGELNDAYQRILGSGLFESVDLIPQGSTLVIKVVEFPTVNLVTFEGNKRLKDEDLSNIVQTQTRRVFSPRVAEEDAQRISEAYTQQGRIAARVSPKVIKRRDNRVDLVFEVFEGGVIEIERIGFAGNTEFGDRRLRRVLATKQAGPLRAIIKSDTFIEDRVAFDQQLLRDFYASRGYVDFRVTGVNSELTQERDGYFVTFNVEEGQQFHVGNVEVTSDLPEVDVDLFQSKIRLRSGKVYSPTRVENEIARMEKLAVREGLNFVRVEPRITRNDRDLTLDVELQLTRGDRIFVERIDIEGNTTTLDRVVRKQFPVAEGDPFNPRAIRESAERIRALGFFTKADVNAREGSTPQQVIIDVDVEEQPTGSIGFGGSYSSDGGIGLNLSFSERNFLGRGQKFSFGVNTTSSSNKYDLSFSEPAFLGRDLEFGFSANYSETNNENSNFDTTRGTFLPFLAFPVSDNGRLQLRYTLAYTDLPEIEATDTDVGGIIKFESGLGERFDSSVGYTYTYDTLRAGLSDNTRVRLEFGQDFGGLGGDTAFVKTTARAVAQTKIFNDEVTLRASIRGGALSYSKEDSRTTDRFRVSPTVMRGFETNGIGPREINDGLDIDDPLGGNFFAVARFEADFSLGLPEEYGLKGGVFYDVGSVWGVNDGYDSLVSAGGEIVSSDFELRHVVGVSLFWDSVLGPLRLDFTEAVKKNKHDKPLNFNISVSRNF